MLPALRVVFAFVLTANLFSSIPGHAAPSWEQIFPAGAARDQQIQVEVRGAEFESWPLEVWTDTTELSVRPLDEKGQLSVQPSSDCPPGVYRIRLYDDTGATTLRSFIVSESVEVNEEEPNNRISDAALFEETTVINGAFAGGRDVDSFAVELERGVTLVASMTANQILESQLDAVLQVVTADGFVVAHNHDWRGLDPRVVYTAEKAGRYIVRGFAFPSQPNTHVGFSGKPSWVYRLTLTKEAVVDYAYPWTVEKGKPTVVELIGWNLNSDKNALLLEPEQLVRAPSRLEIWRPELAAPITIDVVPHSVVTESRDVTTEPRSLQLPCSVTGIVARPDEADRWTFDGKKDQHVRLEVRARRLGSPLDAVLEIKGPDGKVVGSNDDVAQDRDALIRTGLPADGTYTVELRDRHDAGGVRYVYVLRALFDEPDFYMTTKSEQVTLTAGKSATVEIEVHRERLGADIEVTALGLPPGVRADLVTSKNDGDAAKKVTLTLTADEGVRTSGPFRIVGRATDPRLLERHVRSPRVSVPESVPHLWVTVVPVLAEAESKKK